MLLLVLQLLTFPLSPKLCCLQFCKKTYNLRIAVHTHASHIGINHPNAQYICNFEWPDNISTFVQNFSCADLWGEVSAVYIFARISSFFAIVKIIYKGLEVNLTDLEVGETI